MRILLTAIFMLLVASAQAAEPEIKFATSTDKTEMVVFWEPPTSLTFISPEGLRGILDFSGAELVYRGDLPAGESAKILFDAMFLHMKTRCHEGP